MSSSEEIWTQTCAEEDMNDREQTTLSRPDRGAAEQTRTAISDVWPLKLEESKREEPAAWSAVLLPGSPREPPDVGTAEGQAGDTRTDSACPGPIQRVRISAGKGAPLASAGPSAALGHTSLIILLTLLDELWAMGAAGGWKAKENGMEPNWGRITASSILKMGGENVTLEREPRKSFFMQQQQQGGSGWVWGMSGHETSTTG